MRPLCRSSESVRVLESESQQNLAVRLLVSTPRCHDGGTPKRMKAQYDSLLHITKHADKHVTIVPIPFLCFSLPLGHPRWEVLHPRENLHEVLARNGVLDGLFDKSIHLCQRRIIRGGDRGGVVQDG